MGPTATLGSAPSCRELSFQEGCKTGPDQVTCDAKQALPEDLSPDSGRKHLTASRFDRAFESPKYSTSAPSLVPHALSQTHCQEQPLPAGSGKVSEGT